MVFIVDDTNPKIDQLGSRDVQEQTLLSAIIGQLSGGGATCEAMLKILSPSPDNDAVVESRRANLILAILDGNPVHRNGDSE